MPYKFLLNQREYLLNNTVKGTGMSMPPNKIINELFLKKCDGNELRLDHYYKFLIVV